MSEPQSRTSPWRARALRALRRTHMYLGLLLMPWVLLFGITALSFNHPTVGRGLEGRMLPPEELTRLTGFTPWAPESVASDLVSKLNQGGQEYRLKEGSARFSGWPLFAREAPGGKEVVILGIDQGRALLTKRESPQSSSPVPFSGDSIKLPQFELSTLADQLAPIHDGLEIPTSGPLRPHPKIHPELRLVLEAPSGRSYNAIYNLSTQELSGRLSSEERHAPFVELLESLHKQHHYPPSFGPTFFWALFSDLTALTLCFWALSGLIMWWQMKKFRVLGAIFLGAALILASLVMISTSADLSFGPESPEGR